MRSSPGTNSIETSFSFMRHASGLVRTCLFAFAALALLGLTVLFAIDDASARGGGGGRGGGGSASRGGGGGGSFGRSAMGGGGRMMGGSRSVGRSSMGGSRSGRTYGGRAGAQRSTRTTRMPGNRVRTTRATRYPQRGNRTVKNGNRTSNRRAATYPPKNPPKNPPNCRGRGCGTQTSGNPPYPGNTGKPPTGTGCRGSYCPPGTNHPPDGRPPYRPPHYPPVVSGGSPPYYPPVPPPVRVASGGGGGGGGGGGQPPRSGGGGSQQSQPQRGFQTPSPASVANDNRYVPNQVICVLRDDLTEPQIDQFLRDNRMQRTGGGGDVRIGVLGVRVFRFQITDGRSVPQVMAALANDPRGVSVQPNYVYQLSEMPQLHAQVAPRYRTASGTGRPAGNQAMQYVIIKLQLLRAHELTRGERVLIAVIDTGVDANHPELVGQVLREINVTEDNDASPHSHGTAMVGAISSQGTLMGVAPGSRVIAIRAFSPRSRSSGQGTSVHIARAIDKAVQEGARVINLSLAGPHDPMVQKAIEEAYARGIVIVAASGNAGAKSPPMYPAAYPQVIAVTATDANDRIYADAVRGRHVAVAAPGVDIFVAAPNGAYTMTTGTSVAAAHISGVIALMLARNPLLDPEMVREMLLRSVRAANPNGRDDEYGSGYADAYAAVMIVDPAQIKVPVAGGGIPGQ